jgi:dihydrolipoamide dehydrogenase
MEKFDLCVIGGGPSGYAAAMRAIDFGKRVLLIEKDKIGGAGLYNGALWSKTMWEYSMKVFHLREDRSNQDVTFQKLKKVADEAIFDRKFQMTCHLKLLQTEAEQKLCFYEKGIGKIFDKNHVEITKNDGEKLVVETDYILVATGSRPRALPHIAVDEKIIVSSEGIQNFEELPESLVILGAGVIGCEFATIFSNLGKTKVFLIDKAPRILPFEDEDVAQAVTTNFEKNGVMVHKGASLDSMQVKDGKVHYKLAYEDGTKTEHVVEKALVAVGRVPNIENIGLENAGIKLTERGFIEENDTQTIVDNIYVAGDVCSSMALVNIGEREARHAVVRMFGPPIKQLVYSNISTIMFLNPEVATVGMGEQEAIKKGISVKVAKIDYSCIARAIAMRRTFGFFKIIVSNDEHMKVLGMRAVGEHASSAIQAVALLIYMNKGIEELANMMHPHPSIIEGIQECMRMLLNKSIYKPSVFKDKLQCYIREKEVCTPIDHF